MRGNSQLVARILLHIVVEMAARRPSLDLYQQVNMIKNTNGKSWKLGGRKKRACCKHTLHSSTASDQFYWIMDLLDTPIFWMLNLAKPIKRPGKYDSRVRA